jgi:hypothetical protein
LKSQKFGIEIEMTGITREMAARAIAGHFSTAAYSIGGYNDAYSVDDPAGHTWKIMRDASIAVQTRRMEQAGQAYSVEVVSPICLYDDIKTVQEVVRVLRKAGAKVNESCGIHVHVNAGPHTPKTLKNIVNIIASKEDMLYKALKIHVSRERYCQKIDMGFVDGMNCRSRRDMSMDGISRIWYGDSGRPGRYHDSRYHGLNLNSVFFRGTIEFRLFNSTLHAGEVKSYIQLCLAISHQALVQQRASHIRTRSDNEKYTFRTWLLRLGMIGDEFKSARLHLLKHLQGNIAWKDPEQAEKQRLALKENRQRERVTGQDRRWYDDTPDAHPGNAVQEDETGEYEASPDGSERECCSDSDGQEDNNMAMPISM